MQRWPVTSATVREDSSFIAAFNCQRELLNNCFIAVVTPPRPRGLSLRMDRTLMGTATSGALLRFEPHCSAE
jgi:hypothetical protein